MAVSRLAEDLWGQEVGHRSAWKSEGKCMEVPSASAGGKAGCGQQEREGRRGCQGVICGVSGGCLGLHCGGFALWEGLLWRMIANKEDYAI